MFACFSGQYEAAAFLMQKVGEREGLLPHGRLTHSFSSSRFWPLTA